MTIPQIAEELRQHCNRDNDAPRLIAELVLPILADTIAQSRLSLESENAICRELKRFEHRLNPSIP